MYFRRVYLGQKRASCLIALGFKRILLGDMDPEGM